METISRRLSIFLAKRGLIEEDEVDIIRFAVELLLTQGIQIISMLVLGYFLQFFWETVLYLCMLLFLKRYTGGYHAKTYGRCYLITMIIYLLVLLCVEYLNIYSLLVFLPAGLGIFIYFGPCLSYKTMLERRKQQLHLKLSLALCLVLLLLFLGIHEFRYTIEIAAILFFTAVMMLPVFWKNTKTI